MAFQGVILLLLLLLTPTLLKASGPPTEFLDRLGGLQFADGGFYLSAGDGVTASVDDLKRGHDGLVVKLNEVIRTLKETELKMNNVFYKLGRHDTNLEGVDTNLQTLTNSATQIEGKLNKHAYNVDFLRRRVEYLQRKQEGEDSMKVELTTVRSITDRLDDRLTDALARLGLVENTTKTLEKRSVASEGMYGIYEAVERPPTLTVYPQPRKANCLPNYEKVGQDCYWFGVQELTFTEAAAACQGHGGSLLTLPAPGRQLDLLRGRLGVGAVYWTGGTDAFRNDHWVYLMTAQPVMPSHWANITANTNHYHSPRSGPNHCAGLTSYGLAAQPCTHRHHYICHVV